MQQFYSVIQYNAITLSDWKYIILTSCILWCIQQFQV